jgi:hypothetical protein
MFRILFVALNYFWLDPDPDVSAEQYCDQHAFKIHSELIESVWDAFLTLSPDVATEADATGVSQTYRKQRHRSKGGKTHPLSRWNTLARANAERSLLNAKSLFEEHTRRTGKVHLAYRDWEFLVGVLDQIPYEGPIYEAFLHRECLATPKDREWYVRHSAPAEAPFETEEFTNQPRCINAKLFPGCDDPTLVGAYRQYYQLKTQTVMAGKKVGFRYLHSSPPLWLLGTFYVKRDGKTVTLKRARSGRKVVEVVS